MKELDKAIINNDIEHIVRLIKGGVDCRCAVLLHIKDQLIPNYFSETQLVDKGVILTVAELKAIIENYLSVDHEKSDDNYRHDTYVKRLYIGTEQMLKAWQLGTFKNMQAGLELDQQAIAHLSEQWTKEMLPKPLQDLADKKQAEYIGLQYKNWQQQKFEDKEMLQTLDSVLKENLLHHYWSTPSNARDESCQQVDKNVLKQLIVFYQQTDKTNEFIRTMHTYLLQCLSDQIANGTINNEAIVKPIKLKTDKILEGKLVSNLIPYYQQAFSVLINEWRNGEIRFDLASYLEGQLQDYPLPGKLKSSLLVKAAEQLLKQYRDEPSLLSAKLKEKLTLQFEGNIKGYYESRSEKESAVRTKIGRYVFTYLLQAWRESKLEKREAQYLEANLLSDIKNDIRELRLYTSRAAMYSQIKEFKKVVNTLRERMENIDKLEQIIQSQKKIIKRQSKLLESLFDSNITDSQLLSSNDDEVDELTQVKINNQIATQDIYQGNGLFQSERNNENNENDNQQTLEKNVNAQVMRK